MTAVVQGSVGEENNSWDWLNFTESVMVTGDLVFNSFLV